MKEEAREGEIGTKRKIKEGEREG